MPVFQVKAAPWRRVASLNVVPPVADVVSKRHVFLGVGVVLPDPAVGNRYDHISVLPEQVVEVGLPAAVTQRRRLPQAAVKALENTQGRLGSRKPLKKSA